MTKQKKNNSWAKGVIFVIFTNNNERNKICFNDSEINIIKSLRCQALLITSKSTNKCYVISCCFTIILLLKPKPKKRKKNKNKIEIKTKCTETLVWKTSRDANSSLDSRHEAKCKLTTNLNNNQTTELNMKIIFFFYNNFTFHCWHMI